MDEVAAFPLPVIAAVAGGVWGGACELVMAADVVVAVETSTFAITPAKLGVAYSSAGVSRFLAALPVHIVKEMFFTATPLSAQRAYDLGWSITSSAMSTDSVQCHCSWASGWQNSPTDASLDQGRGTGHHSACAHC